MATRLKLNRVKFLEACRAALKTTKADVAKAQSELKQYNWREEAKSRVKELNDSLKDPKISSKEFYDNLYKVGRRSRDDELQIKVKRLTERQEEIQDLINLSEIEVGEEISISTSDSFVLNVLRLARKQEA